MIFVFLIVLEVTHLAKFTCVIESDLADIFISHIFAVLGDLSWLIFHFLDLRIVFPRFVSLHTIFKGIFIIGWIILIMIVGIPFISFLSGCEAKSGDILLLWGEMGIFSSFYLIGRTFL